MNYQTKQKLRRLMNEPLLVWLFLAINVAVFLGMIVSGYLKGLPISGYEDYQTMIQFGALSKMEIIQNHEFWRLITPIFVHLSWSHLVVNSITLYFVGIHLERLYGHFRFFLIYLLTGIAGNALSFATGHFETIYAGASTSLFGLFGIFIVLGQMYPYQPLIQQMSRNMRLLIFINILFSLLSLEGINMGHAGGLVGGLLLAYVVPVPNKGNQHYDKVKNSVLKRNIAIMLFIFFVVMCLVYGYRKFSVFLP